MDLEPTRTETTSVTGNENLAGRMDEDNFQRTPATSHPLELVDDEYVSKKARVARNALHIRGEDKSEIRCQRGSLDERLTWRFPQAAKVL